MDFCPLCNKKRFKVKYFVDLDKKLANISKFKIFKCGGCKLVFSSLLDYPAQIDSSYEEDYFSKYDTSLKNNPKIQTFKNALKILEKIKPNKGNILDFGCAEGNFLILAKQKGWNAVGLDLSKFATKIAKKRDLKVINKTIQKAKLRKNSFDVIALWDAIEHLSDLDGIFKEFRRIIKKDGLLVIRTPNVNSVFHKIAEFSYILSFKNITKLLKIIYHTDHLYYFSKSTLTKILRKNDFEVKKIIMNDQSMQAYKNPVLKLIIYPIRLFGMILGRHHAMLVIAAKK